MLWISCSSHHISLCHSFSVISTSWTRLFIVICPHQTSYNSSVCVLCFVLPFFLLHQNVDILSYNVLNFYFRNTSDKIILLFSVIYSWRYIFQSLCTKDIQICTHNISHFTEVLYTVGFISIAKTVPSRRIELQVYIQVTYL